MTTPREAKLPRRTRDNVVKKKQETTNSSHDYDNHTIELTFDVITIIFKNLGVRDLYRAAAVCRSWNEAASKEKRLRGASAVASFDEFTDSWMNADRVIDKCGTKPMFGIMFTRPFDNQHPATAQRPDCPCKVLPSDCQNIIVGNYGLVNDRTELEENPEKASWMLFPYEKNVTIETVCVPVKYSETSSELEHHRREAIAERHLKKLCSVKSKVKCFILLTDEEEHSNAVDILKFLPRDQNERSISGGVVCNLTICKKNKTGIMCTEAMSWIGILISGESVRSWSIVLKKSCNTDNKVEERLKLLKSRVVLNKHAIGFMFACSGRGQHMFRGKRNVESNAFKELFPNVPLIGSFGGGEYGDSTLERNTQRVHQYSTIFMIVTYG